MERFYCNCEFISTIDRYNYWDINFKKGSFMSNKIVPLQKEGSKSDNLHTVICKNKPAAKKLYSKSSNRLLDVNNWGKICNGITKAHFKLCDEMGKDVNRMAKRFDHLKIDVPGPGPLNGEGYDWVQIEETLNNTDSLNDTDLIGFRVRPTICPLNDSLSIAHFFTEKSTSTFLIRREGKVLTAEIHGRNEKPNERTENLLDTVRNKIIGTAAIIRFSDIQWKQLAVAFLS
jgi:hypothetical protein